MTTTATRPTLTLNDGNVVQLRVAVVRNLSDQSLLVTQLPDVAQTDPVSRHAFHGPARIAAGGCLLILAGYPEDTAARFTGFPLRFEEHTDTCPDPIHDEEMRCVRR